MDDSIQFLLSFGSILLLGLATDAVGKRTSLPRVSLLILLGLLTGPQLLQLIPYAVVAQFELITNLALLMVGFLLGGRLTGGSLRKLTRVVLSISGLAALVAAVFVAGIFALIGIPLEIAILMGCIASATDPSATYDVVSETRHTGRCANVLLAIVAIDDVWAFVIFSLGLTLVSALTLQDASMITHLQQIAHDLGGAVIIGIALGLPAAYFTGRIRPGKPMLVEALALVFICGGLAMWQEVSFIVAAMVLGATIANLAHHHMHPFHEIENIEWPFMIIFFVLAGASLDLSLLPSIGLAGMAFILARIAGKYMGTLLGAMLTSYPTPLARWLGIALLPQAGVAIGLGLLTANHFPEQKEMILSVVIGTTVLFEIFGPIITRLALRKMNQHANTGSPQ